MPQAKGHGGKNRRKGKTVSLATRELVYKLDSDSEVYGRVTKSIGNGFVQVLCFMLDGNRSVRCHIRGKMRKRVWLTPGDIVLVSIRDYEDSTADVIHKYNAEEVRILRKNRELPDTAETDRVIPDEMADLAVVFDSDTETDGSGSENEVVIGKQSRTYDMLEDLTSDSDSDEALGQMIDEL